MKKLTAVLPLFIAFIFALSASAQGRYLIKDGDPNGINKWYMEDKLPM